MCIAVITGGPIYPEASAILMDAKEVYCADSGLDYCIANGIKPDRFYGDMDSVSEEGRHYLEIAGIPVQTYNSEKDKTDTELVLDNCPKDSPIILVCSLTGRIDHVVANLGLLIRFKSMGYDITATDGVSDIIPMIGPSDLTIEGEWKDGIAVSLIPFANEKVEGVTTANLYYELNDAALEATSSFSISNKPKKDADSFRVSIKSGRMLITLTKPV